MKVPVLYTCVLIYAYANQFFLNRMIYGAALYI
jgi:hypothetical protein